MRGLDFSSWEALTSTLFGLAIVTLIGVGIRLLVMQTLQQKRERENRQINERLRTLIAAYKTLGGSFTGGLSVDPTHRRDLRLRAMDPASVDHADVHDSEPADSNAHLLAATGSDRARRIRDAVEAALSDVILLGTDDQVRLAARAAQDMVAGRSIHTHALVVSLRDFIRQALDLAPVPAELAIPQQGPTRPSSTKPKEGKGNDGGEGRGGKGGGMGGGVGGMGGQGTLDDSDVHHRAP